MAIKVISWLLAIPMLGMATGMRAMTPLAAICWFAYFNELPFRDTWAFWTALLVSAVVFTVLALAEYVGDKLPKTPARIGIFPLASRLVAGGLVGALIATALSGSAVEGVILGVINAFLGTFAGYFIRRVVVERTGWPDRTVAFMEDGVCIAMTVLALTIVDSAS